MISRNFRYTFKWMNKNKQNINVDHISQLAAIELSEEEKKMFQSQLENVLLYIDQLNELDISEISDIDEIKLSLNDLRKDDIKALSLLKNGFEKVSSFHGN